MDKMTKEMDKISKARSLFSEKINDNNALYPDL